MTKLETVIIDSGFLISLTQSECWAMELLRQIHNQKPTIVLPNLVKAEFDGKVTGPLEMNELGLPKVPPFFRNFGLGSFFDSFEMYNTMMEGFGAVMRNSMIQRPDVQVLSAAIDHYKKSRDTYVATVDKTLIKALYERGIRVYSPSSVDYEVDFKNTNLGDYLVLNSALKDLHEISEKGTTHAYLHSSPITINQREVDLLIGATQNAKNDKKKTNGRDSCIPVLFGLAQSLSIPQESLPFLLSSTIAFWHETFPYLISIGKRKNPLTSVQEKILKQNIEHGKKIGSKLRKRIATYVSPTQLTFVMPETWLPPQTRGRISYLREEIGVL